MAAPQTPLTDFDLSQSREIVDVDLGSPEVTKAYSPPLTDGKHNGISVPDGARWIYLKFSTPSVDMQQESVDPETIRQFAAYTVQKAGWVDWWHWSRPKQFQQAFPEGTPHTPLDFILGKLTAIRVSPDGESYAEGFLWPKGKNRYADMAWDWLQNCPEMVHCSAGGPVLDRETAWSDGQKTTRLRMAINHIALCPQGVNHDTEVRTAPFGEFVKAVTGVTDACCGRCDGRNRGGCFRSWVRGDEQGKGVLAEGPAGTNTTGMVPEDLEGARRQPESRLRLADGPRDCEHFANGLLKSPADAVAHYQHCLNWSEQAAHDLVNAAIEERKKR